MKVCYFGLYAPKYSRNLTIIKGLIENGVEVIDCGVRAHLIYGWRYPRLILKFLITGLKCDLIFVGFPGQTDVPLAWLLGKLFKKPVVFDAFISLYNTHVDDRQDTQPHTWKAKIYYLLDKYSCILSNLVLLDTNAHINYFSSNFGINIKKFQRLFVGTDEDLFQPYPSPKNNLFTIGFHGSFLPLQGVENIILSANQLRDKKVAFKILGEGITKKTCIDLASNLNLSNVQFLPWVPYYDLPAFISSVDICLGGPFGKNSKANLVIPNKIYESTAMEKPVIVGKNDAISELYSDKIDCFMVNIGSYKDISKAILRLKNSPSLRKKIAVGGHKTFLKNATSYILGQQLKITFKNILTP